MWSEDNEHEEKTTWGCQKWRKGDRQKLQGSEPVSEIQEKVFRVTWMVASGQRTGSIQ